MILSLKHIKIVLIIFIGLCLILVGIRLTIPISPNLTRPLVHIQVTDSLTANQIIEKSRLGSIRREFPEELLEKTLDEIEKLARQSENSELARKAKKALKLLKDGRFQKP